MKRILPVLIVILLIGAVFVCLPKGTDNKIEITSLSDLNECTVGIQSGTSYEIYLEEKCPDATPVFFNEFSSMYPAVQQGKIDVMLTESISFAVEKTEIPSLVAVDEPLCTLEFANGVCQNSQGKVVLAQLNEFIAKIKADGTLDKMKSYWITDYDRGNTTVDRSGITGENGVVKFTAEASFEPACFAGEGNELTGYDIEFIYRFCREYGYTPEIFPLEYDAIPAALASGKATVAVGMIPDEERAEEISFTDPMLDFDIIAAYDDGSGSSDNLFASLISSFNKTFIRDARWKMFLQGVGTTLLISVLSAILGTALGLLIYMWCTHGKKAEKKFTAVLCWILGSTPTVVLLMILYYIIFGKYLISNIAVAVAGFSLMFGCSFYELILSGVNAVGPGQAEAARAQGFNADKTFFHIIFPQAATHFMPAYQSSVITLIQETSVVGYIAIMDLTKMSDLVRARTYEAFFPLLATAGIYFLIIWIMTAIISHIAKILNSRNRKPAAILRGIKTDKK